MKSSGIHDYYKVITFLGIGVFVLASALVIFLVGRAGGEAGGNDFAFDAIDSSSCVACHTNESIIAASTWGEGVEEVEDTGG